MLFNKRGLNIAQNYNFILLLSPLYIFPLKCSINIWT